LFTDGVELQIDTASGSGVTFDTAFYVTYKYILSGTEVTDSFDFIVTAPCQWTSLTTDNALTGTTITYTSGSGPMTFAMDSIISQTPSCSYSSFTYFVREMTTYSGTDLSTIGITVDAAAVPNDLVVDSSIAAITLSMEWWVEPEVAQDTILYF
jgi:hypothetical protein